MSLSPARECNRIPPKKAKSVCNVRAPGSTTRSVQTTFVLRLSPVTAELSDADLARAIGSDADARAAERLLVQRFAPRIRLYGLRHLGTEEAARDLIQDVLLKVIVALREGRLEKAESLASFVLGPCRNVVWDPRRKEKKARRVPPETAALHEVQTQHVPVTLGLMSVLGCLGKLPERDSLVVRMSFTEDRSAEEIGARLGLTAGNVRVVRHRALARLAECLGLSEIAS